jgi:hypothetical protein
MYGLVTRVNDFVLRRVQGNARPEFERGSGAKMTVA